MAADIKKEATEQKKEPREMNSACQYGNREAREQKKVPPEQKNAVTLSYPGIKSRKLNVQIINFKLPDY